MNLYLLSNVKGGLWFPSFIYPRARASHNANSLSHVFGPGLATMRMRNRAANAIPTQPDLIPMEIEMSDERYSAGYEAAKAQAASLAKMYEREIRRVAVDTWMTSPARRLDFTPEAMTKEREMENEGWRLGEKAKTAEDIAVAITHMTDGGD